MAFFKIGMYETGKNALSKDKNQQQIHAFQLQTRRAKMVGAPTSIHSEFKKKLIRKNHPYLACGLELVFSNLATLGMRLGKNQNKYAAFSTN